MRKHLSLSVLILVAAVVVAAPSATAACVSDCDASAGRLLPVGHFSAPGVERRTAAVVMRRDVVVTAAQTFMHDRRWRAPLHSYRFRLGSDGKGYQIGYLILGTGQPLKHPSADWAVVKLVEAVDAAIEPLEVRHVKTGALAARGDGPLRLAYFTGSDGERPIVGECRLTGGTVGAAYHDCITDTDVSGAPLIALEGGKRYLGLLHVDRAGHERRVAGGSVRSGSVAYNLGIRVNGDFYRRILEYASR